MGCWCLFLKSLLSSQRPPAAPWSKSLSLLLLSSLLKKGRPPLGAPQSDSRLKSLARTPRSPRAGKCGWAPPRGTSFRRNKIPGGGLMLRRASWEDEEAEWTNLLLPALEPAPPPGGLGDLRPLFRLGWEGEGVRR